jgi:transcriptional regulator with XRE-family HTH domain
MSDKIKCPDEISFLFRSQRDKLGITLEELVLKIKESGHDITNGYLSRVENGKVTPSMETAEIIAVALGLDPIPVLNHLAYRMLQTALSPTSGTLNLNAKQIIVPIKRSKNNGEENMSTDRREEIIKKIAEIADKSPYWSKSYEDIATWHLAEVYRIVNPLIELSKKEYDPDTWEKDIAEACADTLKRASGATTQTKEPS